MNETPSNPKPEKRKLSIFTRAALGTLVVLGVAHQTDVEVRSPSPPVATVENPFSWVATPIADVIDKTAGKTYGVHPRGIDVSTIQQERYLHETELAQNDRQSQETGNIDKKP